MVAASVLSFEGHSVETAKPLFVAMVLKLIAFVLFMVRIVMDCDVWFVFLLILPDPGRVKSFTVHMALSVALGLALAISRLVLGDLEETCLRTALRRPLQLKWASSFKVDSQGKIPLHTTHYPSLREIWSLVSIYCLLSLLSLLLLPMHIRYFSDRFSPRNIRESGIFLAVLATMTETFLGIPLGFALGLEGNSKTKEDGSRLLQIQLVVIPYLWMCFELALRNGYVLWVLIQKLGRWRRKVSIIHTHDQQVDQLRMENNSRTQWVSLCICATLAVIPIPFGIAESFQIKILSHDKGFIDAPFGIVAIALQMLIVMLVLASGCFAAFLAYRYYYLPWFFVGSYDLETLRSIKAQNPTNLWPCCMNGVDRSDKTENSVPSVT